MSKKIKRKKVPAKTIFEVYQERKCAECDKQYTTLYLDKYNKAWLCDKHYYK